MTESAPMYRIPDLARYLGLSVGELEALIRQGSIPVVPPSQEWRVHESDLFAYLDARAAEVERRPAREASQARQLRSV